METLHDPFKWGALSYSSFHFFFFFSFSPFLNIQSHLPCCVCVPLGLCWPSSFWWCVYIEIIFRSDADMLSFCFWVTRPATMRTGLTRRAAIFPIVFACLIPVLFSSFYNMKMYSIRLSRWVSWVTFQIASNCAHNTVGRRLQQKKNNQKNKTAQSWRIFTESAKKKHVKKIVENCVSHLQANYTHGKTCWFTMFSPSATQQFQCLRNSSGQFPLVDIHT